MSYKYCEYQKIFQRTLENREFRGKPKDDATNEI